MLDRVIQYFTPDILVCQRSILFNPTLRTNCKRSEVANSKNQKHLNVSRDCRYATYLALTYLKREFYYGTADILGLTQWLYQMWKPQQRKNNRHANIYSESMDITELSPKWPRFEPWNMGGQLVIYSVVQSIMKRQPKSLLNLFKIAKTLSIGVDLESNQLGQPLKF